MNQQNSNHPGKYTFSDAIKWEKQSKQHEESKQYNIWLIIAILSLFIVVAYIIAYYAFTNAEIKKQSTKDKEKDNETDSETDAE